MALDEEVLKSMMIANVLAIPPASDSTGVAALAYFQEYYAALAKAIVDHIKASGEVQTDSGAPDGEHHGIIF